MLEPQITAIFGWRSNNYTSLGTEYHILGTQVKSPLQKTRVPVVLGSTCFPCLYLIITLTVLYIICSKIISSCFYCVGQWPHFLVSLRNYFNFSDRGSTFCSDTDSGCQSTLDTPCSEHNSSPRLIKPSLSLGLTKPCCCCIHSGGCTACFHCCSTRNFCFHLQSQQLLPQKSKFNSLLRKTCGQKNKTGHWLRSYPKTLIQKLHTVLRFQVPARYHHRQGDRRV